jgi:hypothetical protein
MTDQVSGPFDGAHNLFTNVIAARLGPLQDNGGPTLTCALLADSPAIDLGELSDAPALDQRGVSRPQGHRVDIGAFELEGVPYAFLLDVSANGAGVVARDPNVSIFPSNSMATIMAIADEDYSFVGWSGDATGDVNPLIITMDRDRSISASFQYAPYTVTNRPGATNYVSVTNG